MQESEMPEPPNDYPDICIYDSPITYHREIWCGQKLVRSFSMSILPPIAKPSIIWEISRWQETQPDWKTGRTDGNISAIDPEWYVCE